ncbi:MAG: 3'-5' exonuclease [Oscillospiraceae bacterium]|nr:3'-5' exonuclease [Oscillospiraceae bacterium]
MFDSLLSAYDSIIFVDTETTGFNTETDYITEFAAIKVKKSQATGNKTAEEERLLAFVQLPDGVSIPEALISSTGITDEMCQTGITPAELYSRFSSLLDAHTLIVAYNAQFDVSFLLRLEREYGEKKIVGACDYLDALTVYRDRAEAPHKLCDAIKYYDVEGVNSHRAMEDAEALRNVMVAMAEEKDDLLGYINRFGYKRKYGISGGRIEGVEYFEQLE